MTASKTKQNMTNVELLHCLGVIGDKLDLIFES
jgi:hypothetical protein